MEVQTVLLGFLNRFSMTGYELKKSFSLSFAYFSGLSYGSIYPALKRMESQGLISMQMEIQEGTPNRKVYTITEQGKKFFIDSLSEPIQMERFRNTFIMKLFFMADLSKEQREAILDDYLNTIKEIQESLKLAHPEILLKADRYQYLCYKFGERFYGDYIKNVSDLIQELKEGEREVSE